MSERMSLTPYLALPDLTGRPQLQIRGTRSGSASSANKLGSGADGLSTNVITAEKARRSRYAGFGVHSEATERARCLRV
jgi:hypothetical protein